VADARAYRERILAAAPGFVPLMTLYLTDQTTPADVEAAAADPHVVGCKLYPAGATTNSDSGVTDIGALDPVFAAMAEHGVVLCVHGEVTHKDVDVFDREARFIDEVLQPIVSRFPRLRVVLEHITTSEGIAFVQSRQKNIGGTITPSTCCSTATPFLKVACGRTTIACRFSSERSTARTSSKRSPQATPASSSVPTLRLTPKGPRSLIVVARESTVPPTRFLSTRKRSKTPAP